jgi:hypothetical protein
MDPYETPKNNSEPYDSPPRRRAIRRITLVEVLIVVAVIAALIAWLPSVTHK